MNTAAKQIRILTVDDHPLLREGIAALVNAEADLKLVGEASNGVEAVEKFRAHRPDVTLMDLQMPEMNGIAAIRQIRGEFPDARIIVLTTYSGDVQVVGALKAGARGYILKGHVHRELLDTIRAVAAGQKRIPPEIAAELAEHATDDDLTHREVEVLQLIAGGNSNKMIADVPPFGRATRAGLPLRERRTSSAPVSGCLPRQPHDTITSQSIMLALKFCALAFSALLPLINPLGSALLFLGVVGYAPPQEFRLLAKKVAVSTVLFLLIIELAGAAVLTFFGISLPVVQLAGGLVLAAMGWGVLNQNNAMAAQSPAAGDDIRPSGRQDFLSAHLSHYRGPRLHRGHADLERARLQAANYLHDFRPSRHRRGDRHVRGQRLAVLRVCTEDYPENFAADHAGHPSRDCIRSLVHRGADRLEGPGSPDEGCQIAAGGAPEVELSPWSPHA